MVHSFLGEIITNELKFRAIRIHWEINEIILQSIAHSAALHPSHEVIRCSAISHIYSPPTRQQRPPTETNGFPFPITHSPGASDASSASWLFPRLISLKFDSGWFYWIVRFNQFISYFHFQFRAKCVVRTFVCFSAWHRWSARRVNACCSLCSSNVLWFSGNIIAFFIALA